MGKEIILIVNDNEIKFDVEVSDYNRFINEMQPSNKVAPAQAFLKRAVATESTEALTEMLKQPGAGINIVGSLIEEYTPDLEITVGKSKGSPSK